MYNKMVQFVDLIFKLLGIITIVLTLTFIVIVIKSCSSTVHQIEGISKP